MIGVPRLHSTDTIRSWIVPHRLKSLNISGLRKSVVDFVSFVRERNKPIHTCILMLTGYLLAKKSCCTRNPSTPSGGNAASAAWPKTGGPHARLATCINWTPSFPCRSSTRRPKSSVRIVRSKRLFRAFDRKRRLLLPYHHTVDERTILFTDYKLLLK